MSDNYVGLKSQRGQMSSRKEAKKEVDCGTANPVSSPSVSPNGAAPGTDGPSASICNQKGERSGEKPLQGCERMSMEKNGKCVAVHEPRSAQERRCEEAKPPKKKRPVMVNTSKAKTSMKAVRMSIRQLQWKELRGGRRPSCDIYWHGLSFYDHGHIMSGQVNKFPGMGEMLRKINLSRAVRTMQELFPEEYDFYPRSWILPEEFEQFSAEIRSLKEHFPHMESPTYIVKPNGGSQGDGIYLIQDPLDVKLMVGTHVKQVVVQEYIDNPLLIDKLKFDIRLYVLIKSIQPLEIYIAKEGLTRFCTEQYQEPTHKNLHRTFMHLTNYSLNVHSCNYVRSDNQNTGSKRTLSSVLYRLSAQGVNVKQIWSDIIALVVKTVIAVLPGLKVHYKAHISSAKPGPTCFQILGFDILLMKDLKPVLLEVNSNPSMRIGFDKEVGPGIFEYFRSPVDMEVKVGVIRDTLRVMNPYSMNRTVIPQPIEVGSDPEELDATDIDSEESSPDDARHLPPLCLKQVYPKYTKQFHHLRLVERIANIFIRFLRVKGNMRLGPTSFRSFIRTCKLVNSNFTMASVDIMYIDITRRWAFAMSDSLEAGLGLQAFVEVFFNLATRRFKCLTLRERVVSLLDLCESRLGPQSEAEERRTLSCNRAPPRGDEPPAIYLPSIRPVTGRRVTNRILRPHPKSKPQKLRANA